MVEVPECQNVTGLYVPELKYIHLYILYVCHVESIVQIYLAKTNSGKPIFSISTL